MKNSTDLREQFGEIDIYLFDQLLKGTIRPGMKVLDAGCGAGRNLVYLMRNGYQVFGIDESEVAIKNVRELAAKLAPQVSPQNFEVQSVHNISFPRGDTEEMFDVIISSAVLHFARDEGHWQAMVNEMWRVLQKDGIFFARLASTIGIEAQVEPVGGRRYRLPDGREWFLVDAEMLKQVTAALAGEFMEPIKTTVVDQKRAMTTWVIRKR